MSDVRVLLLEDAPAHGELVQAQLVATLPDAAVDTAGTALAARRHGRLGAAVPPDGTPNQPGVRWRAHAVVRPVDGGVPV